MRLDRPEPEASNPNSVTDVRKTDCVYAKAARRARGVRYRLVNTDFYLTEWNHIHISRAALGRFIIADFVARSYKKILYVDGDTLFIQDPMPLLKFAACRREASQDSAG